MKHPCQLVKFREQYLLVNEDKPVKYDMVYSREHVYPMIGKVVNSGDGGRFKVAVEDSVYTMHLCKKVIALPNQISVEEELFKLIMKNKGHCFIEMEEDHKTPILNNNKVIIS